MISVQLSTAYAIKAAITQISNELSSRYNPLKGMPIMYYDWEQGFTKQFKQEFAKIPTQDREAPWFCVVYSYGESMPCEVQTRDMVEAFRELYSDDRGKIYAQLRTRLLQTVVIFSILTNDSNYADSLCNNRVICQSYHISLRYQDVLFPSWQASIEYPSTFKIISTIPNGFMYKATNTGISGMFEPTWPKEEGAIVKDGNIIWECIPGEIAKASISNLTYPRLVVPNVYDEGIRYRVDTGFKLNFIGIDDLNIDLHTIQFIDNRLYQVLSKAINI